MKKLIISVMCVLAVGCSSYRDSYDRKHNEVTVKFQVVDKITLTDDPNAYAVSSCNSRGDCVVQIRKDKYPLCITHEVRHAFEGNWHPNRETTEGCYYPNEMR